MKLKKNIYKKNTLFSKKFLNKSPWALKKGDYIRLVFLAYNQKRRGGNNFRITKQTALLHKKKRRKNSLCFLVSSLYKKERVFWRYLINAPHMIKVIFLRTKM